MLERIDLVDTEKCLRGLFLLNKKWEGKLLGTIPKPISENDYKAIDQQVCTTDKLIRAYGTQGEKTSFCEECADFEECKGINWLRCPYRTYYITKEVRPGGYIKKRKTYKKWNEEYNELLIQLYKQNISYDAIADKFSVCKQTVITQIEKFREGGLIKRRHKKIDWTYKVAELLKLREKKVSYKEIAKELNVDEVNISWKVKELKKKGVIENVDYRKNRRY